MVKKNNKSILAEEKEEMSENKNRKKKRKLDNLTLEKTFFLCANYFQRKGLYFLIKYF